MLHLSITIESCSNSILALITFLGEEGEICVGCMFAEFRLGWEQREVISFWLLFPKLVFFCVQISMATHLFSSNFHVHPNDM